MWKFVVRIKKYTCHTLAKEDNLSETKNFRLFQTARVCRDNNVIFDGNGVKFSYRVENTVEKGEIARNEQFLLFQ